MARSPLKHKPLTEISIPIAPEAEDAISVAFEDLFGQTPSFYVDEKTKRTTAKIYIDRKQWTLTLQKSLSSRLAVLRDCGFRFGRIKVQILRAENWAESWKKHFKPIQVGDALLIKPSWSKLKPKKKQQVVVLDPGLSFGTGQHATTSFCLEQIVKCRRAGEKQSFLDIGTGSGILAIAAAKTGYSPVQAFDFDPESIRVSRENVAKNDVEKFVRPTRQDLTKLPLQSKLKFDLVCANLIYDLLLQESERITNRVKPGGSLVLAGILKTQFDVVQAAFKKRGFKLSKTKKEKEWQSGFFISLVQ
ncbi:MAG: 50S ribosomal protein L11 methyltransferase [Verrucomicrobia bacterium]|nr:50S ribosomal protein L11 methyltransferase [Verrucomicrobiota bacterium]